MAVEAHHLHHFFSPQLLQKRDAGNQSVGGNFTMNNMHLPPLPVFSAAGSSTTAGGSITLPIAASGAENFPTMCRKRLRTDDFEQQFLDVDRLVLQHTEKVRIEIMERGKRFLKQIILAVEQNVAKRLKAKDEEIERIGKINWALEERIKSLWLESQIWRDLAQSNEATANMLRTNLEQALAAAVDQPNGNDLDAESCCCGEVKDEWKRTCRSCERGEPSVLLLPCRHLCLCSACGTTVDVCPVCSCTNTGTVNINLD